MPSLSPGTFKVCVHEIHTGRIAGEVAARRLTGPISFHDTGDLVLQLEAVMDSQNFPQAYHRSRSFVPTGVNSPFAAPTLDGGMDPDSVERSRGRQSSFLLRVLTRRSSTWQGLLTWEDAESPVRFHSVLELVRLIDAHFSQAK